MRTGMLRFLAKKTFISVSLTNFMRYSHFLDVTQCVLVVTDVSTQPIGPIFEASSLNHEDKTARLCRNVNKRCMISH